jgi:hypothetical protein
MAGLVAAAGASAALNLGSVESVMMITSFCGAFIYCAGRPGN